MKFSRATYPEDPASVHRHGTEWDRTDPISRSEMTALVPGRGIQSHGTGATDEFCGIRRTPSLSAGLGSRPHCAARTLFAVHLRRVRTPVFSRMRGAAGE